MKQKNFDQKIVVISGAGKGIGKEIALGFAKEGAVIVFFDKKRSLVEQLKSTFLKLKVSFCGEILDITDMVKLEKFVQKVVKKFGKIDILINNVGIGTGKRFFEVNPEDMDIVKTTTFKSPFFLTQKVAEFMNEGGNIIFITSIHAEYLSLDPIYDSTKAAVNNLIKNLALQLSSRNIRVNGIAPGHIDIETKDEPRNQSDVPLYKKAGLPEDIAQACLFLTDNKRAKYITGAILPVTGGLHIPRAHNLQI